MQVLPLALVVFGPMVATFGLGAASRVRSRDQPLPNEVRGAGVETVYLRTAKTSLEQAPHVVAPASKWVDCPTKPGARQRSGESLRSLEVSVENARSGSTLILLLGPHDAATSSSTEHPHAVRWASDAVAPGATRTFKLPFGPSSGLLHTASLAAYLLDPVSKQLYPVESVDAYFVRACDGDGAKVRLDVRADPTGAGLPFQGELGPRKRAQSSLFQTVQNRPSNAT